MGATAEDERGGGARRAVNVRLLLARAGIALVLVAVASWFLLSLGSANPSGQLETDCVHDQQAISDALANADVGKLRGAATGNALLDLTDQVIQEQSSG